MKKVWEETWEPRVCCENHVYIEEDGQEIGRFDGIDDAQWHAARAKLAAAAPEMARLLVEFQYEGAGVAGEPAQCIACGREQIMPGSHEADCRLVAVLRKAGIELADLPDSA